MWPYDISKFTNKPTDTCYTEALKHQVLSYHAVAQSIEEMKGCLAEGYPFVIGISVYESFESGTVAKSAHAALPKSGESVVGGHAVVGVGYDDAKSWFVVRNSWGAGWGLKGYFTLPYAYVADNNLASDFWTIRVVQ